MGKTERDREDRIGMVFNHPKYGEYEIVRYGGCMDVDIRFRNTGSIINTQYAHSARGAVRDCMQPTVFGVGVVGHSKIRKSGVIIKSYSTWRNMLGRCYDENTQERRPTYVGCSVCDEWHYYPNFKLWHDKYYLEGYELDKDIKVTGNKIYSPETCMFVTPAENTLSAMSYKMYGVVLSSPDGEEVIVHNQREFCNNQRLNYGGLHQVISGKRPHHKGWKFIRRLDDN